MGGVGGVAGGAWPAARAGVPGRRRLGALSADADIFIVSRYKFIILSGIGSRWVCGSTPECVGECADPPSEAPPRTAEVAGSRSRVSAGWLVLWAVERRAGPGRLAIPGARPDVGLPLAGRRRAAGPAPVLAYTTQTGHSEPGGPGWMAVLGGLATIVWLALPSDQEPCRGQVADRRRGLVGPRLVYSMEPSRYPVSDSGQASKTSQRRCSRDGSASSATDALVNERMVVGPAVGCTSGR
jgi:hypothetical protein